MSNNEYDYGGFDFDKGLDVNFDDDTPKTLAEMSKREVITEGLGGTVRGVGKGLTDASKWRDAIRRELPGPFKETWQAYDDTKQSFSSLYNQARKEVKPVLGQIAKSIDNMIPEKLQKTKKITSFLKEKLYDAPGSRNLTPEELQNQAMEAMLGEIFKGGTGGTAANEIAEKNEKIIKKKALAEKSTGEQIEFNRHKQTINLFSRIDTNLQKLTVYQERVGISIDRKNLELSFRKYTLLADIAQQLKRTEVRQTNQLQNITLHTGLPEFKKVTMSDRFRDTAKKRMVDGVNNKVFGAGSLMERARKKITADSVEAITKMRSSLEMAMMGIDEMAGAGDTLAATGQTVPGAIGDFAGQWIGDILINKFIKKAMPEFANDPEFKKFGFKLGAAAINPKNGLNALKKTDQYKKIIEGKFGTKFEKLMDYVEGLATPEKQSTKLEGSASFKGMLSPETFTRRLNIVQTEVVPGYLARILQQVTSIRTGSDEAMLLFDPMSGAFKTSSSIKKSILRTLKKDSQNNSGITDIKNLAETLKKEMSLGEDSNKALIKLITSLMHSEKEFNGDSIKGSKAYENASPEHKKLYDQISEKLSGDSLEKNSTVYQYEHGMRNVRKNLESGGAVIQEMIDAGFRDQLIELGVIKKDEYGSINLNEERARRRVEKTAIASSDVELKDGLKSFSGKRALRGIKRLEVQRWKYKDKLLGNRQKIGPMAQDLQKELGEEVAPGGKKVDLVSANGATMAAIQELAKNQDAITEELGAEAPSSKLTGNKKWRQTDYLKAINDNIVSLHETLKNKTFSFGIPGVDFGNIKMPDIDLTDAKAKAKKLLDPLIKTGNQYVDTLQSLLQTGLKDTTEGIVKGYNTFKNKIFTPSKDGIKDFWNNNKKGIGEKKDWFLNEVVSLSSKALKFGNDVLFKHTPEAISSSINFLKNIKEKVKQVINSPVDVYLKDGTSAVLLASKMRAGVYAALNDGKIIVGIDDLLAAKCDIVDISKNSEVALRWSDASEGLFDQKGKPLRTTTGLLTHAVVGLAVHAGKKAFNLARDLLKGPSFLKGARETVGRISDSISKKLGGFSGLNFSDVRQLMLLAQIRDLTAIGKKKELLNHVYNRKLDDESFLKGNSFLALLLGKGFKGMLGNILDNKELSKSRELALIDPKNNKSDNDPLGSLFKGIEKFKNFIKEKGGIGKAIDGLKEKAESSGLRGAFNKLKSKLPGAGILGKTKNKLKDFWNRHKNKKTETSGSRELALLNTEGQIQPAPNQSRLIQIGHNGNQINQRNTGHEDGEVLDAAPRLSSRAKVSPRGNPADITDVDAKETWRDRLRNKFQRTKDFGKNISTKVKPQISKIASVAKGAGGVIGKGLGMLFGGKAVNKINESNEGSALSVVQNKGTMVRSLRDGKGFNDSDQDGNRDGGSTEQMRRFEIEDKTRKEANAAKAAEVAKNAQADSLRYKSSENSIDSLIKNAGSLIGMLMSGATGLFSLAGGVLGKLPLVGGALKSLGGGIAKGAGAIGRGIVTGGGHLLTMGKNLPAAGKGIAAAARTGLTVARTVAMAAGGIGGTLLGVAATVLQTGLAIISAPITGWLVLGAAVAYGLYRGYKYFTKNNLDDFEKLRAIQYGLSTDSKDLHLAMELEGYFLDGRISFSGGTANFNGQKIKAQELLDIMGIGKDDEERANKFNTWLNERFKPFFLNHLNALFSVNKKLKLNEIEKLNHEELNTYLDKAQFLDGPYSVTESPFLNDDVMVNSKEDIPKLIEALKSKHKGKKKEYKNLRDQIDADHVSLRNEIAKKKEKENLEKGKTDTKPVELNIDKKVPIVTIRDTKKVTNGEKIIDASLKGDDGGKAIQASNPTGTFATADNKVLAKALNTANGPLFSDKDGSQFLTMGKGAKIEGVHPVLKRNLLSMAAEYGQLTGGGKIIVTDGFRTFAEQKALHREKPNLAAAPGTSMHEKGLALDIDPAVNEKLEKFGLLRKYGFTRPIGGETWHIEPSGLQVNIDKAKNDPAWATDQIEKSPGRGGGGYGTVLGSKLKSRNKELARSIWEDASDIPVDNTTKTKQENTSIAGKETVKKGVVGQDTSNVISTPNDGKTEIDKSNRLGKETVKKGVVGQDTSNAPSVGKTEIDKSNRSGIKTDSTIKGYTADIGSKAANDPSFAKIEKPGLEKTKDIIKKAATRTGIDPNTLQLFAAAESSMGQNQNSGGAAEGPFQFMPATWKEQINKHGKNFNLDLSTPPTDLNGSALMAGSYLKDNTKFITKHKSPPDVIDYYLSHMLGPGDVQRFLKMQPDEVASKKLIKPAINNPNVFFKDGKKMTQPMTAGEVRQGLVNKFDKLSKQFGVSFQSTGSSAPQHVEANSNTKAADKISTTSYKTSDKTNSNIDTTSTAYSSPEPEKKTNRLEERKQKPEPLRGEPGIASGVISIMERTLAVDEKLLAAVQNDMVPVLKRMNETLEKIYGQGGGMSKPSEEKEAPATKKETSRGSSLITGSQSVLDRTRKYG